MRRAVVAAIAVSLLAVIALVPARPARGRPLWPGARYTAEDRDRAIQRGMLFFASISRNPALFRDWGHDMVGAFQGIAATSRDSRLRTFAWNVGRERAAEWRRLNRSVPPGADESEITTLAMGSDSATRLGLPDRALWNELREAAARLAPSDFFFFDPAFEPPPSDVPYPHCGLQEPRGARSCSRCGKPLEMRSRYDLWLDALITAYSGDRYGITLGANYVDVLHWLPAMRPYPKRGTVDDSVYLNALYAVTHLVYTLNDYSLYTLDPRCLPDEFAYLADNLTQAIAMNDPETMGEFLDTLRAFGLGFDDPRIRTGIEYVLSTQNADGSWGDPKDPDLYNRYHSTWTAIDGLRDYRWGRPLPCIAP